MTGQYVIDSLEAAEKQHTVASGKIAANGHENGNGTARPAPGSVVGMHGDFFHMGTSIGPNGRGSVAVDSVSLLRDGKPWLPVMGEFHYSRYPENEWRDELLKMRSGGIDVVATYVFWIHHEEVQGAFDWNGRRSLHEFVRLAGEVGMSVVVRCGPWCHGECRNGGLPDWLLREGVTTRSDDPGYLRHVRRLYAEIAEQIGGLLWKDGGPVIGIQCENEYDGPAEHLLSLKRIARDVGIDVPLYTRTGWPQLTTPMPSGELLPLFGGYADGFWDRSCAQMPPGYGENFLFRQTRNDATVATDQLGVRDAADAADDALYPYFACEIGGGMMTSYHRRIRIAPKDIEALALAKLGSGNNLQGYYMYHGGTNPDGVLSTLQESQETGYWNDLPVKSYDFQAPIGEFGQVRPHYHSLRRLHLFLRDFGAMLAAMPAQFPAARPADAGDISTLRWSMRTNGRNAFLFVNNYQRLQPMPAKEAVRFEVPLAAEGLAVPNEPIAVPADCCFFWPVHLDLDGADLIYATAQPICRLALNDTTYVVFAQMRDLPAEFLLDEANAAVESHRGVCDRTDRGPLLHHLRTGTEAAICLRTSAGRRVCVILLDADESLTCWKATLSGQECLFLTRAALICDGDRLQLQATDAKDLSVGILPAPFGVSRNACTSASGDDRCDGADGLFCRICAAPPDRQAIAVRCERLRGASPPPPVAIGCQGVAEPPSEAAFEAAASVWRLHLPADVDPDRDLVLRIRYTGDVARVLLNGALLTDNFYNGDSFDVGLRRYAPDVYGGELLLTVMPLRPDAPIYLPTAARPWRDGVESADQPPHVEVIERHVAEWRFSEGEVLLSARRPGNKLA
jgi:hypothetical protein